MFLIAIIAAALVSAASAPFVTGDSPVDTSLVLEVGEDCGNAIRAGLGF